MKNNTEELIEIVDENGNFTGQVMNKDEAHDVLLLMIKIRYYFKKEVLLKDLALINTDYVLVMLMLVNL